MDYVRGFFNRRCQRTDVVTRLGSCIFFVVPAKDYVVGKSGISRRGFLLGTGATLLLTTLYTGYQQIGEYPASPLPVRNLTDKEVYLYQILGDWLLPPQEGLPGSGGDAQTIMAIDELFAWIPEKKRFLLSALPLAFEHGTILDSLGAASLSQLSLEKRHRYLNEWAEAQNLIQTQLLAALKTIFGFAYFEREDVLIAIGIPPFCQVLST